MSVSENESTYSFASSGNDDEELNPKKELNPKMLILQGDKTREEARLEQEGNVRDLQVFRYNLYQHGPKINYNDTLSALLYWEEELRKNCQEENVLGENLKRLSNPWSHSPLYQRDMSRLIESTWDLTRQWQYAYGCILGNSGALPRALKLWRSDPLWYMHSVLVEDCQARGGCCGRDCGCCVSPQRKNSSAGALGVGHCTLKCGCCLKSRGFELNEESEKAYVRCFTFEKEANLNGEWYGTNSPYKNRIMLASILGISVKDE